MRHSICLALSYFFLIGSLVVISDEICADPKFKLLQLPSDTNNVKWGEPTWQSGAIVTYSFATTEHALDLEFGSCKQMLPFDQIANVSQSAPELYRQKVQLAFRMWEQVANVQFREVTTADADVLIGLSNSIPNLANVSLTRSNDRMNGLVRLQKAAICFGSEKLWTLAATHNAVVSPQRLSLSLAAAHEIGHVLGLDHPPDSSQLMYFKVRENLQDLQTGDIGAIQLIYGERVTPDMSPEFQR